MEYISNLNISYDYNNKQYIRYKPLIEGIKNIQQNTKKLEERIILKVIL